MNSHHTRDFSYSCPHCPFVSCSSKALKTHKSTAHGQKSLMSLLAKSGVQVNDDHSGHDESEDYCSPETDASAFIEQITSVYGLSYSVNNDGSVEFNSDTGSEEALDEVNCKNLISGGNEHYSQAEPHINETLGNSGPEIMQVALNPFDYALPSSFSNPRSRRRRKRGRQMEQIQDKQYPCPQCSNCFQKLKDLMNHMKSEHPGFKSFPCSQCDFVAPKSSLLKYHVQAVHKAAAGALVFQCPKCPYCSPIPEKLKQHVRVKHNRIRPYKCPHCSYSSTQAGHIRIHVRAKHTNEKPYHCTYCSYQSAYASALKSHIAKRHTNN